MGTTVGYNNLLKRIKTLWKSKALTKMVALENNYFIVRLSFVEDYNYAKFDGPGMVFV